MDVKDVAKEWFLAGASSGWTSSLNFDRLWESWKDATEVPSTPTDLEVLPLESGKVRCTGKVMYRINQQVFKCTNMRCGREYSKQDAYACNEACVGVLDFMCAFAGSQRFMCKKCAVRGDKTLLACEPWCEDAE